MPGCNIFVGGKIGEGAHLSLEPEKKGIPLEDATGEPLSKSQRKKLVKLAKDNTGTRYAIKIIHSEESFQELIDTEVGTLAQLNHVNIVRLVEVNKGMQVNPKKGSKEVRYVALELIGGGELFDFVALGGRLSEGQARYYYK